MPNCHNSQISDGGVTPNAPQKSKRRRIAVNPSLTFYFALLACLVGVRLNNMRLDDVIPAHALPADNAHIWYVRAECAIRDRKRVARIVLPFEPKRAPQKPDAPEQGGRDSDIVDPTPAGGTLLQKQTLLAQNQDALRLLRQGFALPYVAPPIRVLNARLPAYLLNVCYLAYLLRLEGQVRAARGDWQGAVNSGLDAIRLGEDMAHGAGLNGKRAGVNAASTGRSDLRKYMLRLNAPQAKAAARKLEAILAAHVSYAEALQEEQREYQAVMIYIMKHDDLKGDLADLGIKEYQGIEGKSIFGSEWWNALPHSLPGLLYGRRWSLNAYNRMMTYRIEEARLPYASNDTDPDRSQRPRPMIEDMMPTDALNMSMTTYCFCLRSGANSDAQRLDTEEGSTVQNALLLAALAIRAYRLEHDHLPPTLAALTPAYLHHAPADPFEPTSPLHYHPHGAAYTLYSVGPDGYDNDGRPIDDENRGSTPQEHHRVTEGSGGDIVAGINF